MRLATLSTMDKITFQNKYNDATSGLFKDNTTKDIGADDVRALVTDVGGNIPFTDDDSYSWPFPGITTSGGTTAYTGTLAPAITGYSNRMKVQVKINATSTGASTLNLNTQGAKKVYVNPTTQADAGDLLINQTYIFVYDTALDGGAGGFIMIGSGGGGGGSGTVTSVSVGNLSPLFTASVADPTTTPAVTFTLVNQNANLVYAGPSTGAPAAPTFRALVAADLPAGTIQDLQSVLDEGSTAVLTAGITITGAFDVVFGNGGSKLNSLSVVTSSGFSLQHNDGTSSAYAIGNAVNLDLGWGDGVSKSGRLLMDPSGNVFSGTSAFTFTPTATVAGFNFGSVAADPSTLNNADVWYDNVLHLIRARVNGASVSLLTSAAGQDLQSVLDAGSSATITTTFGVSTAEYISLETTGASKLISLVNGDGGSVTVGPGVDVLANGGNIVLTSPSGSVNISGSSGQAGRLLFYEQTTNGTNYVEIKALAALPSTQVYTLPPNYPVADGYSLISTTAGEMSWSFIPSAVITGFVSGSGTVAATDTILQAIQKLDGNNALDWKLTGTSTLTGATIIANGGNTLTFSGAATTTFSHTVVNGFRVTGTITTTSASNQQHTLFDPTVTTRATVSDIFSAVAIKPTITAGTTGQTLYGLIVDATGISTTNSPIKYAAHFIGGLSVVLSSGAVSPVGLLVNRTTSNGIILNVQSNSSNLFSVSDASSSTAVTIVGLGTLTACLNIAGTIVTSSGESNVVAVGTTLTAGANSDTLRTFRLRPTYGINSRTSVTTTGFLYAPAAVTITSGSVLAHYGLVIDGSVASINIFSGFMVAAPTAFVDCGQVVTAAASLRIRPGSTTTAPGSPNSGDVWHEGTGNRLMFRQGSTSIEVIGASSVNSISPTSPDRTITVLLNNVTYYIHAKTTND